VTGRTYTHWFKSCVAFSLVIHVIVFKILIETVNWNWISTLFGVICFASYYVMVFAMNMPILSPLIQPEINGEFLLIFTNIKAAICLVLLPPRHHNFGRPEAFLADPDRHGHDEAKTES
jgi:hypothetical protein